MGLTQRSPWGLVSPGAARAPTFPTEPAEPEPGSGGGCWGHTGTVLSLAPPRRLRRALAACAGSKSECQPWWVSLSPLHGCDCGASPAHAAPGQAPSGSSGCWHGPWGCGTWNWDSTQPSPWDEPSVTDPVCAREGDKFGHCFPSSNIISCFFNIKARCCWKNVLPSLFFHQIILQRNIWQQLTNGLLLPVGAAAPVPHSCRGSWQMPPATTVPIIPCHRVTQGTAGMGTRQHRVPCSEQGAGEKRNICHVFHLTLFHPKLLFPLV